MIIACGVSSLAIGAFPTFRTFFVDYCCCDCWYKTTKYVVAVSGGHSLRWSHTLSSVTFLIGSAAVHAQQAFLQTPVSELFCLVKIFFKQT